MSFFLKDTYCFVLWRRPFQADFLVHMLPVCCPRKLDENPHRSQSLKFEKDDSLSVGPSFWIVCLKANVMKINLHYGEYLIQRNQQADIAT